VNSVSTNHNHDSYSAKGRYFRCHKNLDSTANRKLLKIDKTGISMSTSYNSLAVEAVGMSILHFEKKNVVILFLNQGIFSLAQETLKLFVTISIGYKQLIMVSTLP
jgi:hypothetical protein